MKNKRSFLLILALAVIAALVLALCLKKALRDVHAAAEKLMDAGVAE